MNTKRTKINSTWQSDAERLLFRNVFSMINRFREIDGEMPVQQMLVFCWVALNEGRTQRDLCHALDMPVSTASRNIAALSNVHRLGKPGHDLVTWEESPDDRRCKLLLLNDNGRRFARQLLTSQEREAH